jgi:Domain of unknown function (DUF3883)
MSAEDWSPTEVEVIVRDYLTMLSFELAGIAYNKTRHRENLSKELPARSNGAIEFKHANISAALIDLGFFYILGYKPRGNYQRSLLDVLELQLFGNKELLSLGASEADRPIVVPEFENILAAFQPAPKSQDSGLVAKESSSAYFTKSQQVNYLEREARNRSLGDSGELFVLEFEKARLISAGKEVLAAKIEHTAKVRGDYAGFDILSFEVNGAERLIEVKTTKYGKATPFFATSNEVLVSELNPTQYSIYRLFTFAAKPRFYQLQGAISSTCRITPSGYLASPR